jgi:hypothetical protein
VASEQRARDQARIRLTSRWLLYGSVAATAIFGGLAARATHAHASSGSGSSGVAVPPSSSSQPPVTQSGGS